MSSIVDENIKFTKDEVFYDYIQKFIKKDSLKKYILLDEVQELTHWERCINGINVTFDVDIYVTGSNSRILSGELATYIAGRYIEIKIFPLSFK